MPSQDEDVKGDCKHADCQQSQGNPILADRYQESSFVGCDRVDRGMAALLQSTLTEVEENWTSVYVCRREQKHTMQYIRCNEVRLASKFDHKHVSWIMLALQWCS